MLGLNGAPGAIPARAAVHVVREHAVTRASDGGTIGVRADCRAMRVAIAATGLR